MGLVKLLLDELAADVLILGACRDRLTSQGVQSKLLALLGRQGVRSGWGVGGLGSGRGQG